MDEVAGLLINIDLYGSYGYNLEREFRHFSAKSLYYLSSTKRMRTCDYRELWIIGRLLQPVDTPKEIQIFLQEFRLRQFALRDFSLVEPRNECLRDKLEMKFQFLSSYSQAMFWMTQKMDEKDKEFMKKSGEMREDMISKVQFVLNVSESGEILLQNENEKKKILDKYTEFG